ncbi:hypothetical protein M1D80_09440 [Phyllobacteriaceae bacterium JZ32]
MIDPETIEDMDDCDGESLHAYGYDPVARKWEWAWIPLEYIYESGRSDIIDRLYG